jgi:hypothetical protein
MTDRSYAQTNAQATAALRTLADSLGGDDLEVDLGGGWSVSMAFAHLAFWDAWHRARWQHAAATGAVAPPPVGADISDRANEALEVTWRALAPDRTVALALDAAAAVDELLAGLPDASVDAARASGGTNWVERWPHREKHIEQILRGLGRA